MRVIVAGAVAWIDREAIRRELVKLPSQAVIIFGDCQGADAIAGEIATELGLTIEPMAKNKEDYAKYRKVAWKGLNERMIASGAELVLAFHPDFDGSKGSKHLAELAESAGIEIQVHAS